MSTVNTGPTLTKGQLNAGLQTITNNIKDLQAGQAGATQDEIKAFQDQLTKGIAAGTATDADRAAARILDYINGAGGAAGQLDTNKDGHLGNDELNNDGNIKAIAGGMTDPGKAAQGDTELTLLSFDKPTLQAAFSNIQTELPQINNGGASKDELTQYKASLDARLLQPDQAGNTTLKAQATLVNEMLTRFDTMDTTPDGKLTSQEFKLDPNVQRALDGYTPQPGGTTLAATSKLNGRPGTLSSSLEALFTAGTGRALNIKG